ncbi:MAG TPA: sigma-70 family RNA polymerase sigma factor [Bacteroidales bacterium]|nr:sigma-70 family RNA polymerase sigma factor [Bacteroidales bacterium]
MAFFGKNYKKLSDEELMSLLIEREKQAFDELYIRYSKQMLNYFYRMLYFDKERAEDMLHDLFLKIIEKPYLFNTEKKFSTWIYTVAGNMLKNEFRDVQIHGNHEKAYGNEQETRIENEQKVDSKLFLASLNKELDKFDSELKQIFVLRYFDEMSIKEIAEIANCPEGTVKSRLFYMNKKLSVSLAAFR